MLHRASGENIANFVRWFKGPAETGGDAYGVWDRHGYFRYMARLFHSHAGHGKINHRAPHLSSRHLETVKVYRLQGSELSPRGEFGIDGECNENTHQFRSYAALRATLQKQETALRPATTKPRRVEARPPQLYAAARAMRLARPLAM